MATTPLWKMEMQLSQAERKLTDALVMYADAVGPVDDVARDLSAARMKEMIRGSQVLRRVFG